MASQRTVVSLNGTWDLAFDPKNAGKDKRWYLPGKFPKPVAMDVPGVWEQVRPGYDGAGWYRRTIDVKDAWIGTKTLRLRFGAVMYYAEVWLNGHYLGDHEGGGSAFEFDVSSVVDAGDNDLVVRVINPPINEELEGLRAGAPLNQGYLPVGKAAWYYNYGGIWQDVELIVTDPVYVDNLYVKPFPARRTAEVNVTVANTGQATTQELNVAIAPDGQKKPVLTASKTVKCRKGETVVTIPMKFAATGKTAMRWWSPDDPLLYRATATLDNDELSDRFGMREFTIKGGRFVLNGKRITLKGYLQQEHYPRTLIFPHSKAFARHELQLVKKSGCNFVRSHLKAPAPWWLDLCDEMGILVEGEPPIGWIGKSPNTERRCRTAIEGLLKRDRNHPSIVFWCLMNEAYHFRGFTMNEIKKMTARLAAAGRKLDDTRLLLDTSGGGGGAKAAGGALVLRPNVNKKAVMTDDHAYCALPVQDKAIANYRSMGKRGVPLFISEFGAPLAPPDFKRVLDGYTAAEKRRGLEDYQLHKRFYTSLKETFRKAGLRKAFGTADRFIAAIDADRAEDIGLVLAAQRCNPTVVGTTLCQLADASGELFGATDVWRNPKKVYRAMAEAAAIPLAAPEITPRVQVPGDKTGVRLTLVNEDQLGATYTWTLQVVTRTGRVAADVDKGRVKATDYIQTLHARTITPDLKPGRYALRATLNRGGKVVCKRDVPFIVLPEILAGVDTIGAWDPTGDIAAWARKVKITVETFSNNYRNKNVPIFYDARAGRVSSHELAENYGQLKKIVQTGGVAVLLNPQPMLLEEYLLPAKIHPARNGRVMGYVKDHPIFAGLPTDGTMNFAYADVIGGARDSGEDVVDAGGTVLAGGMQLHMWTRPADADWGAGVYTLPVGRGQVVICQLNLLDNLATSRTAQTIMNNLAHYAAEQITPGLEHLLLSRCIDPLDPKDIA
ncbi:MAG: glycoside hydrolase family 2 protein [Planctomycetota bacterium]